MHCAQRTLEASKDGHLHLEDLLGRLGGLHLDSDALVVVLQVDSLVDLAEATAADLLLLQSRGRFGRIVHLGAHDLPALADDLAALEDLALTGAGHRCGGAKSRHGRFD